MASKQTDAVTRLYRIWVTDPPSATRRIRSPHGTR
jgi:hypothetical protein